MNLKDVIEVLKTYSFVDIESRGVMVRKQYPTAELSEGILRSYLAIHSSLSVVPKKMLGNSPMRLTDETIHLDKSDIEGMAGLGSIETPSVMRGSSAESELYKIMYENARAEASEYKRKYEDALNDKHKAEIQLAAKGDSGLGEIVQGLAGFAPIFFGGGGAAPALGDTSTNQQPQPQAQVVERADVRLQGIVRHFSTLTEENKAKVYNLLVKVFTDLDKIDQILPLLD